MEQQLITSETIQNITHYGSWTRKHPDLYQRLIEQTSYLSVNAQPRQRGWHILHDCHSVVLCAAEGCNNAVKWNNTKHQYQHCCSNACSHALGEGKKKQQQTNMERYGVTTFFKDREKVIRSWKESLGVDHPQKLEAVKNKLRDTNKRVYGVECPLSHPEVRERGRQTARANFQPIHPLLLDRDWLELNYKTRTQESIAQELNVAQSTVGLYIHHHNIHQPSRSSSVEREMGEFLASLTSDVLHHDRKVLEGKELDFLFPSNNFAVEVNGVFWHSEANGKGPRYHLNKTIACKDKGISLVHVYDVEWLTKRDIVKSRLSAKLNIGCDRLYARKLTVCEIDNATSADFMNQTHIQGHSASSIQLALKLDNQIVAVMTFGKPRYTKAVEYELIRYSTALNTKVVGGAGKLFAAFVRIYDPSSVISYCDSRWNEGNVYKAIGFKHTHTSQPNYKYFKRHDVSALYSRQKFQKHKLKDVLDVFDASHTESANMLNNGYDRIWDCGNTVWMWFPKTL